MRRLYHMICLLLSPWLIRSQGELRIINGRNAWPGLLPYQVALEGYYKNIEEPHICGGTIIHRLWILTAAHCLTAPNKVLKNITVIAGVVDKYNENDRSYLEMVVQKKHTIVHERYNRSTVVNDIGLIRLPKALTFNRYVRPARLPRSRMVYNNRWAIASGWGHNSSDEFPDALQYVKVKIISNLQCARLWKRALKAEGEIEPKVIYKTFLCIDTSRGLPCGGDSGGPLVLDDGSWTVVGVVSHGFPGCKMEVPDILTRVSQFVQWIEKHTGSLGEQ